MIDKGKIIFQEEKDILLESYRIVKGDSKDLTKDTQKYFADISNTAFGFTGITNQLEAVRKAIPNVITERITIEDVMLCNIKGGSK